MPLLALTLTVPVAAVLLRGTSQWAGLVSIPARVLGAGLLLAAVIVFRGAKRMLGDNLVATPMPVAGAVLHVSGVYGAMRHPMYSAIICGVTGWALLWNSVPGLILSAVCAGFFLAKSRYEEVLLLATFTDYAAYQQTVPALVPRWWRGRSSRLIK